MNKFLVGFLVVLAGGVFGWYYLKGDSSPSVSEPVTSTVTETDSVGTAQIETAEGETLVVATASITYSDTGFAPVKITVKKGTAVTFTNQSSGNMWVAADVHPTHQLLPGFDQLKGVAKGSSYEYAFVKAGTWTYHNHLSASHVGTIVVTE